MHLNDGHTMMLRFCHPHLHKSDMDMSILGQLTRLAPIVAALHQATCELSVLTSFRTPYCVGVCTVVLMKTFGRFNKI